MKRTRRTAPATGLKRWTIQRASAVGAASGLAALLLATILRSWPEALLYPYAGLLALAAACGASILWITAIDMRDRGTSGRMRPIRGFDLALGLILLIPSVYGLSVIVPELGL